jgi:serine phosphatase RsbU (regulator of sigma subunit)
VTPSPADTTTNEPPGRPPAPDAARTAPDRSRPSIRDFLTDGSLPGMCTSLSRLLGVRVELLDEADRPIRPENEDHLDARSGVIAWRVGEPGSSELEPARRDGTAREIALRLGPDVLGRLVIAPGEPRLSGDARERMCDALSLFAEAVSELCASEVDLRHRLSEIDVLHRLAAHLAGATSVDEMLAAALDSALEVLALDAGSIVLLKEDADGIVSTDERDLELKTSRHLSREWLESPLPLSKDRAFDRLALAGEIVVSERLGEDQRVLIPDRCAAEGLVSAIQAGLIFRGRPIGVMRLYARSRRSFGPSDRRIVEAIARQAAVAVQQARLLRDQQLERRMERQLKLAAAVQRRMLPRTVPQVAGFDIAARYVPSFEVGGDFYDLFELGPHNVGVLVGDVVGKGVAAGMLMASVRATLRAHVQDLYDLDEIMARVNRALCRDTLGSEFATAWYGVFDARSRRVTFVSAGHEPTLLFRPGDGTQEGCRVIELATDGMVLGIDPSQAYVRSVHDLRPGDVAIAYSDGVPDTMNFDRHRFGKPRLRSTVLDLLSNEPGASASRIAEHVFWSLRQHTGLAERVDDQTLVVARVEGV